MTLETCLFFRMNPTLLRERIKTKLKEARIKIAEAERLSGLGPSSLRNFLSGRIKSPTIETLSALCKTLKCDLADLLEEETETEGNRLPWNPELFIQVSKYLKNKLEEKKLVIFNEEAFTAVKEAYILSCKKEEPQFDKEFSDWYLENVLNKK